MPFKFKITRKDRLKKLSKKSPIYRAAYAYLLLKEGKVKEARRLATGKDDLSLFVKGCCLVKEGRLEEAFDLFYGLAQKNPVYFGVHLKLVEVAKELDRLDEVEASVNLLKSVYKCPILEDLEPAEVVVIEEGEESQDEDVLVLEEESFVTVEMVRSLFEQFLFEEAYEHVKKLLELEPENEEALELKAKIEEYLKYLEPEEPVEEGAGDTRAQPEPSGEEGA